jgi:60 kDa SS-A/Ro ribonucleoprotein
MVHPKPKEPAREALYGYFVGRDHDLEALPAVVRNFEAYKRGESQEIPDVPFQMLTSLETGS